MIFKQRVSPRVFQLIAASVFRWAHVLWVSSWECLWIVSGSIRHPWRIQIGMNDRSQYSNGLYNKTLNLPPFRQANGNCCDDYKRAMLWEVWKSLAASIGGVKTRCLEGKTTWFGELGSCSDTGVGFMVPSPILEEKQRNVCGTAVQPPMHRPGYTCDEWIHHDPAKNSCEFMKRERVTEEQTWKLPRFNVGYVLLSITLNIVHV